MGRGAWAPAFAGATMKIASAGGGAKQIAKPERISNADDVVRGVSVETERDVEIDLLGPGQQISAALTGKILRTRHAGGP
jgi:hypothetical protein